MANFDDALKYVLQNEGGWRDGDPPGSCTNCGLTQDAVSSYLGTPVSVAYMRAISNVEISQIYHHSFWQPMSGDAIVHQGVATAIFDQTVNRGPTVAAKYVQSVLNARGANLKVDGILGPITTAKLNQCDPDAFIRPFAGMIKQGYQLIVSQRPDKQKFLHGWINRADRLLSLIGKNGAPISPSGPREMT